MRNFKRFLTLALAMVMLVSAFAMGTSAAKFTDVDEENEYLTKAVNLLSYVGVTKGTTDTTFGTDELVTREQMAAFIYRLMKKGNSVEGGDNTSAFTDLEDPTFFFMVSWANNQGIIKGTSATTFEPKGTITLQDAYTMVVRALGYEKEETLAYPYGYIDVAEAKGVELGEGLDSSVSYTDALTRGDVAVILYNAFFAETGVAETKQVEREIGSGENATWVLETVTDYPTFCEKYFDVIEAEYQAIATPNYVFGADETTAGLGYDAIEFVEITEDGDTDAPDQMYVAFEDLGLEGDANDYIMSHFTMYVILDDDDEIEEILYAEPLMVKKNVTELELGTVTTNTANSYLDSNYSVKRLNGKVTIDGDVAYFYGAPYSYAAPKYATGMDDAEKYDARNAKNLKFIEFSVLGDVEDEEYAYTLADDAFAGYEDEYFIENTGVLLDALKGVYVGGLYEADVYDVDGDGLYDYINYMPYEAYFVNTDEDDGVFYEDGISEDGVAYTAEAVLAGVEFEDEDFVIGYFDQASNYIKAAAVIEPIEGKVTAIKRATGIITLNGETKVSVKDGWKTVANNIDLEAIDYVIDDYDWDNFDYLLSPGVLDEDDDAKFYVYNDVLLYQEGIDSFVKYNDNLLIVTKDEDGEFYAESGFNPTTGKTTYVHVYVDGETKYVPLNTEAEVYPEFKDEPEFYLDQLATYSVDGDGLYTIELLGYALDEDDEYVGITWVEDLEEDNDLTNEDNEDIQAYGELEGPAYLVKYSTRFSLRDGSVYKESDNLLDFDLFLTDSTTVIVKNTYEDDGETVIDFIKLGKADIKETVVSAFTNVKYIVENNVDYDNRENLVLLYAEVEGDFELKATEGSKKNERIVKMMDVAMNENGKYYAVYDLFNPYTGAVVENVPGTETGANSSFAPKFTYGDVVEISTDDKVMDKTTDALGNIVADGNGNENVFLVVEYIASENSVVLAPIPTTVGDDLEAAIEAQGEYYTIDVTDAKVTIIGHQSSAFNTDMVRWGSLKVADVAKLDGSDKSYLATAKWSKSEDTALKTVYAQYVKVYADIDWEKEDNREAYDEDTDFNGEANFLVVIANSGENTALCTLK